VSRLFLVGVGPGDPELLTRKAERVLREVDVIAVPVTGPNEQSQALGIVREFIDDRRHQVLPLLFPMRSEKTELEPHWKEACKLVSSRLDQGKSVAFITLGDPLFYATSLYLLKGMQQDYPEVPIEVVPGVSSIFAAASEGIFPLAEATEKMTILPATAGIEAIRQALQQNNTLVLLKIKPAFAETLAVLEDYPTARLLFAQHVGMPNQIILTDRAAISAHTPDYLSLLIIRKANI
jgi:precorrin-2/cobalt-factor-2 C20-methyltransferase